MCVQQRASARRGSLSSRGLILSVFAILCGPISHHGKGGVEAADRNPIDGPRAQLSSFYDWASLDAVKNGAPGVALIDEESCVMDQGTQPANFDGNLLLNCDTLGIRNETTVAVNPIDPEHVVAGSHRYRLLQKGSTVIVHIVSAAYVSRDSGASWTNVIPPLGSYQFIGDPALAFNSQGHLYYAFIADHEGQGGLFTNVSVVVYRSFDGGNDWQGPVTVAPGNGGVVGPQDFNDKVYIAVDAHPGSPFKDRIYVTWTRFLTGPAGQYVESPIYVAYSDDLGETFSTPKEISGSSSALCPFQFGDKDTPACDEDQFSQPVVGPDGTVYVAFENFQSKTSEETGRGQMLVVRSQDGGETWEGPFFVTTVVDGFDDYPLNTDGRQTVTGCAFRLNSAGNLTVDPQSGTLYLVWDDNRNGTGDATNNDVFLSKSTDGGQTWSAPVSVTRARRDQFYPWAAVGPEGEIVVGYMDRQYQPRDATCQYGFTLSVSSNGGKSFRRQRVDTGLSRADDSRWFGRNTRFIGDYNNVAVGSDGNAWPVWTDLRRDVTFLGVTRATQDAVAARVPIGN